MLPRKNDPAAADVDRALADFERAPLGELFAAAGRQTQPRPAFVAQLRAQLDQRARTAPARHAPAWPRWRPFSLAGAALVLLVVLAGLFWLNQPAPVSAAQVLARVDSPPALQSFHGVMAGQHRERAGVPASTISAQWEIWYQAPGHVRLEETAQMPGGQTQKSWLLTDGTSTWNYDPPPDEIQIQDADPAETNVFGATSLGQIIQATNHAQYDATLLPPETIAGRAAYVLDLTERPNSLMGPPHSRLWVDQQTYIPLREEDQDAARHVVSSVAFTSLEFNVAISADRFTFVPPPGIPIRDMRTPGGLAAQAAQWQQVAQQAGFTVFRPGSYTAAVELQTAYDPATRQVAAQITLQLPPDGDTPLRFREARPADLRLTGPGTPVALGDQAAAYRTSDGQASLSLERDGTRIVVETADSPSASALLIKTAQALVPAGGK